MQTVKEQVLEVRKLFPVSKERLYKAWVDTEELKKWWHPLQANLEEVEYDLSPNGKFRYGFRSHDNGLDFDISGYFMNVDEGNELAYTWNWNMPQGMEDGSYRLKVVFSDHSEGCSIAIEQENLSGDESVFPHKKGWEKGLDALYEYLTNNSGAPGQT